VSDTTTTETPAAVDADLLIIGAGPAGLYAAYYAGFRGFKVAVMDSLPEPGGQVAALYPEKLIYDVAGFPAVKGQALIDNLVEQAAPFDPVYLLGHRAQHLTHPDGDTVVVKSHKATTVTCKAVVITGGIGTFTPRPLPDAERFEGRGLMYFVPKLDVLAGLDVLIVGGGDSAFDWAHNLEDIAKSVTLVHRRDRFRAHEHTVQQVLNSSVRVMTHTEVAHIFGDEHGIKAVEVFDNRSDERQTLDVQAVVAALGFTADLGPLKEWGLEQQNRSIVVDTTMATNLPRVFAAGDITDYPGKVKLIAVGFGEAATAVNNAATVIDPGAKLFPGHSSG
jgi:ferredoxin/flavodoxin---NADP+ reductase